MSSPLKRPAQVESEEDDKFVEEEDEEFVEEEDEELDRTSGSTKDTTKTTDGATKTIDGITKALSGNPSGKRVDNLSWNDYFMSTALLAAQRSKDPDTQVGACIVDSDNRVVAIGYNGFPRECDDDHFPWRKLKKYERSEEPLQDKNMYVVHAEANAILNKNAVSLKDTRLYVTLFPCNECTKLIIQSGIAHIYYLSDKKAHKPKYQAAKRMLQAAGIPCEAFKSDRKQITLSFNPY